MKFESLPNELLLELFDYINDIQLLRIFYNLNSRFNRLFLIYSKKFHLNFQSITKTDLDLICRQSLPRIINQIISLHLSDDDDTPYQIIQFFSYNFNLRQLIHLTKLSLYNIRCSNSLNQILSQLSRLHYLNSLKINQINFNMNETDQFIRIIWSLPKLIYFYISGENFRNYCFMPELIIYSSFKYLYMIDSRFTIDQLIHLFECTLYLENLSITVYQRFINDNVIFDQSLRNILPPLTKLNIKFIGYLHGLEYIFQLIPDLYYLKIETFNLIINGYKWQEMICNYLLKLKIFHLQMLFQLVVDDNTKRQIDELIKSFQTSFWINERQLFFRCHWDQQNRSIDQYYNTLLYTLPYAFENFNCIDPIYSKSTCLDKTDYWLYNQVHTLCVVPTGEERDASCFPVRFLNIRHLTIAYRLKNIAIMCPTLDHLTTLYIQHLDSQVQPLLQTLIDRAPRLQTIVFYENSSLCFSIASKSVRRIIIRDGVYYNVQECGELSSSILFNQCEVLEINLKTRGSVFDFLRRIPNLRVLNFKCERDEWKDNQRSSLLKQDELVKWLKRYLPSECLIKREKYGTIRLWIR